MNSQQLIAEVKAEVRRQLQQILSHPVDGSQLEDWSASPHHTRASGAARYLVSLAGLEQAAEFIEDPAVRNSVQQGLGATVSEVIDDICWSPLRIPVRWPGPRGNPLVGQAEGVYEVLLDLGFKGLSMNATGSERTFRAAARIMEKVISAPSMASGASLLAASA